MLAAGLGTARALPFAVRAGQQGAAVVRGLTTEAEKALSAMAQSVRNRLGRNPTYQEIIQGLGLAPDVGVNRSEGLGNPFKSRAPEQIDEMFQAKGFEPRGDDPISGIGGYQNPKNERSYHIQPDPMAVRKGIELPHVDVNRPRQFTRPGYEGPLQKKRKFPLGDKLYDWE